MIKLSEEEIIKYLEKNDENNYQLGVLATLTAIISILIQNKITTKEEFEKIQNFALEKTRKQQVENMTEKEKSQIETLKAFEDLFGGIKI